VGFQSPSGRSVSFRSGFFILEQRRKLPLFTKSKTWFEGKPIGLWQKLLYLAATKQVKVVETLETNNKNKLIQDFIKKRVGPAGFEPATNGL